VLRLFLYLFFGIIFDPPTASRARLRFFKEGMRYMASSISVDPGKGVHVVAQLLPIPSVRPAGEPVFTSTDPSVLVLEAQDDLTATFRAVAPGLVDVLFTLGGISKAGAVRVNEVIPGANDASLDFTEVA